MNKLVVYSTLAVAMMAGAGCLVPVHSQDRAVQTMTLSALYNLADQQSQRVKVSEVALQAADQGVAAAKAALLPSCRVTSRDSIRIVCAYIGRRPRMREAIILIMRMTCLSASLFI